MSTTKAKRTRCRSRATAKRLPDLIGDVQLVTIEGGPHDIAWTHAEECNEALLDFLAEGR